MELKSYDIFPKVLTVSAGRANEIFDVIENFVDGNTVPIVEKRENEVCFWFSEFKVVCYSDDKGMSKEELKSLFTSKKDERYDQDSRIKLAMETYRKTREKFLEGR